MLGFRKNTGSLFALILIVIVPSSISYAGLHPADHSGLYIGFGFGYGSASFNFPDDEFGPSDFNGKPGVAGNFCVGGALNQVFLFGVETNGWVKNIDGASWTLISGAATMTVYPYDYIFFRIGPTAGNIEVSDDAVETPGGLRRVVSRSNSGYGATFAAGVELRIMKNFAIVPSVRYVWLNIEDVTVDLISGIIGVGWYW